MKKLLLISAFALCIPTAVKAQQTVSQTTINQAITDAKQHFCTNGISGFAKYIKNCYQKNGAADKCLLEDISLSVFDYQFREAMKQQTGQEVPPSDVFFSQPVSEARYKKYFLPKFGDNNKGYSYLKPGIIQVTDTMGKCLDNTEKQTLTTTSAQQPTQQNNKSIITKEGDGETQTPPVQLNCPCMITWKMDKRNNIMEYFDLELNPVAGGFPIPIASMSQNPKGEYYIPANQSGQYMMKIHGTGHWAIQIQQNYQQ